MAIFPRGLIGQSTSALPSGSDVNLFGDGESVVNLDAEIPDGALDLGVTEQQLDSRGRRLQCRLSRKNLLLRPFSAKRRMS